MLVVDLLPAGFEIESVAVGKGVNKEEFSNLLPELSDSFYQSNNDDRYIFYNMCTGEQRIITEQQYNDDNYTLNTWL